MFTRILKVLLWFGVIAGAIGSLILGGSVGEDGNSLLGFFVALLGLIVTLVSFSLLGVLVEISENIRDSRIFLWQITNANSSVSNSVSKLSQIANGDPNSVSHSSAVKTYSGTATKLSQIASGGQGNEFWYCTQCGEKNSFSSMICKSCGKYK